jgi:hypothetical protein
MKNKAEGFYSSSLEMLLDTMCSMLGGVVFISLMVALIIHDAPPATEATYRQNALQLTNELAEVTASNAVVQAELVAALQKLQDPRQIFRTNEMRLPNLSNTAKHPWTVIVRYDKLYPMDFMPAVRGGVPVRNDRTILRTQYAEPRPDAGEDADSGIAQMAGAFRTSANTNYYFEFFVYEDSFDAFVRAREEAARLGFQYGWEPLQAQTLLQLTSQAGHALPQN